MNLISITQEIVAVFIGLILGYLLNWIIIRIKNFNRNKFISKFFLGKKNNTLIIHSAVYDKERDAYDYPACDTKATRFIASVFSRLNLKEDKDFFVHPVFDFFNSEAKDYIDPRLEKNNLILICSPKRNKVTEIIMDKLPNLRYKQEYNPNTESIKIHDSLAENDYISTEDSDKKVLEKKDYAIIISTDNPLNKDYRVVIISGNHGEGTLGAAKYLSNIDEIKKLIKNQRNRVTEKVLIIKFEDCEIILDTKLL